MTTPLFDYADSGPAPDERPPDLSPDARRTVRQLLDLQRGTHPLARVVSRPDLMRLHPQAAPAEDRKAPGRRCGNCAFRRLLNWHNRTYPKCLYGIQFADPNAHIGRLPRVSHGAATDVRAWWPGCVDHEYGDPELSPDAARSGPGEQQ